MKRITLILALLASCGILSAKVELPSIIGSNMVIQQKTDAALWGKAAPKSKVTVTTGWNGAETSVKADKDGRWSLTVKTPAASLEAYTIKISDGETVTLENVLVGDVWLCSGQSNMDMRVRGNRNQPVNGSADIIMKAKPSRPIRLFKAGRAFKTQPQENVKGSWRLNSPEMVSEASAAAYFFADYINDVLEIPIGLVQASWGGSKIEAWMSRETFEKSFKGKYDLSHLDQKEYSGNKAHQTPALLYNGMLAPMAPYSIKGILWYQGCSNRSNYMDYAQLQADFVEMVRRDFKSPDAPFYFVQIAPYSYGKPEDYLSGYFCEAQEKSLGLIPNSGMVTTIDCGEKSIIHPAAKDIVGKRLAYLALTKTYGMKGIEAEAPKLTKVEFQNGKALLTFSTNAGLFPNASNIENFELAGEDKVFHKAKARLILKKMIVEVSSDEVPAPVAVRYGFRNWCVGELVNTYGIPVGPFRTDDWPYEK